MVESHKNRNEGKTRLTNPRPASMSIVIGFNLLVSCASSISTTWKICHDTANISIPLLESSREDNSIMTVSEMEVYRHLNQIDTSKVNSSLRLPYLDK